MFVPASYWISFHLRVLNHPLCSSYYFERNFERAWPVFPRDMGLRWATLIHLEQFGPIDGIEERVMIKLRLFQAV